MEKVLINIYHYFAKNRLVFYAVFIASVALMSFFALRVKFEEDISKVIPKDKNTEKLNEIFQNSKFIDKLIILVSLNDSTKAQPDSLVAYTDAFSSTAQEKLSPYIKKASYKVDGEVIFKLFESINQRLPIYLTEHDYQTIDTLIQAQKVKETLRSDLNTLTSPAGIALKKMISADPVGLSFIGLKKLQQLQYDKNFELYEDYVVTKDHKHLLMFITPQYPPNNTGKNTLFIKGLDSVITALNAKDFKHINASYFGAAAGFAGNADQLRKDTALTLTLTIVVLVLFLGIYFQKKTAPIIILIPVLFGGLFSLSLIWFVKGSLSVIALATGSVVLGIAINYSLHVFNHYRHVKSVEQVIKDLMQPLTIGSFTTIGGFFCLEFVQSDMLKDLGLFAGFSLIGASLCSLVFLPQFIISKKEPKKEHVVTLSWIDKVASYNPEYNKFIVAVIVLITVGLAFKAGDVKFEFDMTGMNYMTGKLKQTEAKLNQINKFALRSVYLVTEGKTLDEALVRNEQLASKVDKLVDQKVIIKYSGVSSFIISDSLQKARIQRWENYWTPQKKQTLLTTLEKEGPLLGFRPSAFDQFKELISRKYTVAAQDSLDGIRRTFLDDFINEKPGHSTVVTLVQTTPEQKATVYKALENDAVVLDKQYLTNKLVLVINSDFNRIAIMSSTLVLVVLLLTYGRIELTLVSFIPMAISWIWILGLMAIFGVTFNIVNIIISALIFGLGDDYSLYIMDGLLQEYRTGKKVMSSYKTSIFLSAITTIVGLGVLIFARHPALRSIAFISIIGICSVVIMSQILIPFFFNILIRDRVVKKHFPWTLWSFTKSIFAFAYFVTGCILLTVLGLLFKLIPFAKEQVKYVYHFILSKFTGSMVYIMANVRKQIIDKDQADFGRPSVIIANHQSFLDILSLVMLHPKLVMLTNDWVWNSPVFGAVARMADFYPVAQGAENSIALLAERVKQGYSIVVFPEGTRSVDGVMKRFHKGAFYLADELKLDIQPILLHGTGYTMTKGDFMLKDGTITIKYLPRIKHDDATYGTGFAERTKLIGRHFKNEYRLLCEQVEQPAWHKEQLIYNYLYKSPLLEWKLRRTLSRNNNFQPLHDLLPREGNILHLGCSYGFVAYLMHFAAKGRRFTGVDIDDEKIDTAINCFAKDDQVDFIIGDAVDIERNNYDAILVTLGAEFGLENYRVVQQKCITVLNPGGKLIVMESGNDTGAASISAENDLTCEVVANGGAGKILVINKRTE